MLRRLAKEGRLLVPETAGDWGLPENQGATGAEEQTLTEMASDEWADTWRLGLCTSLERKACQQSF